MMISNLFKLFWQYIDIICFLAALVCIVWGCFLINQIAGLFSIGISLILIGLEAELISSQSN
ncbi:DUF1056 family protein [Limosilactobacillus mucosae]|uniref:DUF1056 family protein n=1 Tax=Limosilactobacillus mucosae TaxID=97478 RepID=UPI002FDAA00D